MEKTNFWKDVAKYGAIIGALLAVSFMLETRLQISASFGLYAIEWIAVVVLHYYLLHRFTRRYSMMYTAEEGFSFGQGYAYILSVSTVAGLIVGIVQYLYLHFFIGYTNYTERTTAALSDYIGRNGILLYDCVLLQCVVEVFGVGNYECGCVFREMIVYIFRFQVA